MTTPTDKPPTEPLAPSAPPPATSPDHPPTEPLAPSAPPPATPPDQPPSDAPAKPYALVIDDDPMLAEVFATALRMASFEVAINRDARDAMDALLARRPALVTLDMQMPHLNGAEILRQIRAHPALAGVKVMVVTASAQARQDDQLETLADLVVMKPVMLSQIMDFARRLTQPR
jgi:CheY-like chemotaxis protein